MQTGGEVTAYSVSVDSDCETNETVVKELIGCDAKVGYGLNATFSSV